MHCALLLAALVGCFHATPPQGAPCDPNGECPSSLVCSSAGFCVSHDSDAAITAGPDADPTCSCADSSTLSCASGMTECSLGCSANHCLQLQPSNGVTPSFEATPVTITLAGTATVNTDTGEIMGSLRSTFLGRAAGTGIISHIGYEQETFEGVSLGVFSFGALTVTDTVHFTGSRPAVFIVAGDADVQGTIDASGGCYGSDLGCSGPGGGSGAIYTKVATGCGAGTAGVTDEASGIDTGGGGGAGGASGANGGNDTEGGSTYKGGTGGTACIATALEPLVGGSGGGGGGPGDGVATSGGGGGGGFQLTAFTSIVVSGSILSNGAGGKGGPPDTANTNGGCGGGGGGGGGILLEAPSVTTSSVSIVAANGGGGGGAASGTTVGGDGEAGQPSTSAATGGIAAGGAGGVGGNGGALGHPATIGGSAHNTGAGGGGSGRIFVRGTATLAGIASPAPGTDVIRTK